MGLLLYCQVKKEAVVSTVSITDKFTIMYSNVDSLPNKKTNWLLLLIMLLVNLN